MKIYTDEEMLVVDDKDNERVIAFDMIELESGVDVYDVPEGTMEHIKVEEIAEELRGVLEQAFELYELAECYELEDAPEDLLKLIQWDQTMNNGRDCKHGNLKRACIVCKLEAEAKEYLGHGGLEMQTGNKEKKYKPCFCPTGHKGVHYPNCHNFRKPDPIPKWVEMARKCSEIEQKLFDLKTLIIRSA